MYKTRLIICLSLFVIWLLLAGSCSSATPTTTPTPVVLEPELMDKSWLTGTPCEAPCWYGLELEKSTYSEVLTTINTLSFLNPARITESEWNYEDPEDIGITRSEKRLNIDCMSPAFQTCIVMDFKGEILVRLIIIPNYDIQIDKVVEILGEPNGFRSSSTGEPNDCLLKLYWLKQQMVITHYQFPNEPQNVCQTIEDNGGLVPHNLLVGRIVYVPKIEVEDINLMNQLESWKGFEK